MLHIKCTREILLCFYKSDSKYFVIGLAIQTGVVWISLNFDLFV